MPLWDLGPLCVTPDERLDVVLNRIDASGLGFVLVVDADRRLIGTITDGDVRRALLHGTDLGREAQAVINRNFRKIPAGTAHEKWQNYLHLQRLTFAPVVDEAGVLVDVAVSDYLPGKHFDEVGVVVMAGGLGSRLGDYTRDVPKPMLEVEGEPILQKIVKRFRDEGFRRFVFCVNHKAEVIADHFGDGSDLGVDIDFVVEKERLGTGGALSLVDLAKFDRVFVTNADILCSAVYRDMLDFHVEQTATATMAVREHRVEIPFGVVETKGFEIRAIREKPTYIHFINAGYYVLERSALEFVPRRKFFDLPSLFDLLREAKLRTRVFPTTGDWIDIGRPEDLARARAGLGKNGAS